MQVQLTKEIIEQAFDEMGRLAADRGITIEIAVYGGSCLILASDIRSASADVDAVFLVGGKDVSEIADQVAARLGLPDNWINESVKRVAPPPGDPQPNLILAGEYPRAPNSIVGLRVHLPTPAYMLAMKILANRVVESGQALSEARALAQTLAAGPPLALAAIKSAVRQSANGTLDEALEREKLGQTALLSSQDFREGVTAWAAKRAAKFQGK